MTPRFAESSSYLKTLNNSYSATWFWPEVVICDPSLPSVSSYRTTTSCVSLLEPLPQIGVLVCKHKNQSRKGCPKWTPFVIPHKVLANFVADTPVGPFFPKVWKENERSVIYRIINLRGALKQGIPTKQMYLILNKRKPDYIKFPKFLIFNGVSVTHPIT